MQQGRGKTRELVRIRDNYTCQDCGDIRTPEQAKKLRKRLFDIHHLNGICGKKSRGYDKISDMPGLITLCHKCHYRRDDFNGNHNHCRNTERDKIIKQRYFSGEKTGILVKEYHISRQRINFIVRS